jgi:hypothetical protein
MDPARWPACLLTVAYFTMPVLGVGGTHSDDRVGLDRCIPELQQVRIHQAVDELAGGSRIPILGAYPQAVATRR